MSGSHRHEHTEASSKPLIWLNLCVRARGLLTHLVVASNTVFSKPPRYLPVPGACLSELFNPCNCLDQIYNNLKSYPSHTVTGYAAGIYGPSMAPQNCWLKGSTTNSVCVPNGIQFPSDWGKNWYSYILGYYCWRYCIVLTISQYYFYASWLYLHLNSFIACSPCSFKIQGQFVFSTFYNWFLSHIVNIES